MATGIHDMDNPPITQQLRDAVMDAWYALRPERLRYLVGSIPRRVPAVQETHGGYTRF